MSNKPLIVIFLGKSGSGKGTQVELLREKFSFEDIATGDLLRARKKQEDFTGKKLSQLMDQGGLVPAPIVFSLWFEKLEELKAKQDLKGIVLDGLPRKIKEAYLLDEALEWYEWDKSVRIILIDISDEEAKKRIPKRKICTKCGYISLNEENICPKCKIELFQRPEDSANGVEKRLAWFQEEVVPVINHYQDKLITINGEQSVENVFKDILKALENDLN